MKRSPIWKHYWIKLVCCQSLPILRTIRLIMGNEICIILPATPEWLMTHGIIVWWDGKGMWRRICSLSNKPRISLHLVHPICTLVFVAALIAPVFCAYAADCWWWTWYSTQLVILFIAGCALRCYYSSTTIYNNTVSTCIQRRALRHLEQTFGLASRSGSKVGSAHTRHRCIAPRIQGYDCSSSITSGVLQPWSTGTTTRHFAWTQPQVLVGWYAKLGSHICGTVSKGGVSINWISQSMRKLSHWSAAIIHFSTIVDPVEIYWQWFHKLVQYLWQLRLLLVKKASQMDRWIIRYDIISIIPRDTLGECLRSPLIMHYRKGGQPTT